MQFESEKPDCVTRNDEKVAPIKDDNFPILSVYLL